MKLLFRQSCRAHQEFHGDVYVRLGSRMESFGVILHWEKFCLNRLAALICHIGSRDDEDIEILNIICFASYWFRLVQLLSSRIVITMRSAEQLKILRFCLMNGFPIFIFNFSLFFAYLS